MLESIGFIRTAVARLSRIIDALLRLSRAGRVIYQLQSLDMTALAKRVVDSLQSTIEKRGATIVVGELPPALADAAAIEQSLANLIGNALNYFDPSRPGRIEIGFDNERHSPGGPPTRAVNTFYVRDNGVGIAPAYLPKLFRAFQRLHPDMAPGEGIGLAITRRVLERLGGQIWVDSVEGVGTTFYFTLPAPEMQPAEKTQL